MRDLRQVLHAMLLIAFWAATLSCTSTASVPRTAVQPDRSADEAAIRVQIAANEAAANRLDAVGVAATFDPEGDLIIGSRARISGREAIQRTIETGYAETSPSEVRITVESIRFLTPNVALAECLGLHRFSTGDIRDRATFVFVRRDESWLISAVRVLPVEQQ